MTFYKASLLVLTFIAVAVSALTDIKTRKIKNYITIPAILLGLAIHFAAGGWDAGQNPGLKWSLIGIGIGALPFLVMNTIDSRAFGMGDVKLMAAVGALLGWPLILEVLFFVAIAGGIVAVIVLIQKKMLRRTLKGMFNRHSNEDQDDQNTKPQYIPYGVAIAGGTLIAMAYDISRTGFF